MNATINPTQKLNYVSFSPKFQQVSVRNGRLNVPAMTVKAQTAVENESVSSNEENDYGVVSVHHVGILCENLEKSLDYYQNVLGLKINEARPHDKLPYRSAWLWVGSEMIHLMELPNPGPLTGRPQHGGRDRHTCIAIQDVSKLKAILDKTGLASAVHQSTPLTVLRKMTLEENGNLRLYRWEDVNGSKQWVSQWAAVSNPCDIGGICGNEVCKLDKTKTNASCTCLPGTSKVGRDGQCYENSSLVGKCTNGKNENTTSNFRISTVQQTNYYFSESSIIANYSESDVSSVSKYGDACLSDCDCVASVYGLNEEIPFCWVLRSLSFGGFEDTSSTLFVKVRANSSWTPKGQGRFNNSSFDGMGSAKEKDVIIPIVLGIIILIILLSMLLYYSVHRKKTLILLQGVNSGNVENHSFKAENVGEPVYLRFGRSKSTPSTDARSLPEACLNCPRGSILGNRNT